MIDYMIIQTVIVLTERKCTIEYENIQKWK